MPHPTRTAEPLPFERAPPSHHHQPYEPAMVLRPAAIAAFDALVHEIHPDAARVDADRLERLAGWLAQLPPAQARHAIDTRLRCLQDLRAMAADPAWDCDSATRRRLQRLFAYVDQGEDLIDDRVPLLGLLDDVLLIELTWPAFAAEAEDYRDFRAYLQVEHPAGDAGEQRAAWVRDRLAELALLQHHARVSDSHYANGRTPEPVFRVT
ncbi:hypothetical protein J5226_13180 [Lysobacter sp. K5869]|uniref:hypothetical protein n=1 Tax=Lysobacter sp. K5869 TaxID=2820808 RepID=UPI001C06315B|nr:hypothetical protein [Lysobacter sp. K5869]QWP74645.1 hypothetical protein J5226_13180 [Lysobacter sp. K5869]